MPEQTSRVIISRQNDITVVELMDKKILDESSISQITEELQKLTDPPGEPLLVLDFTNVGHMSSSALSMLITLHKRVKEKHGQLRLCNIRPTIFEVFKITRLNEVFGISPTREKAVAEIQGK